MSAARILLTVDEAREVVATLLDVEGVRLASIGAEMQLEMIRGVMRVCGALQALGYRVARPLVLAAPGDDP